MLTECQFHRDVVEQTHVSLTCGASAADSASASAKFNAMPRNESDAHLNACGTQCGAAALRDSTCVANCLVQTFKWDVGCSRCLAEFALCITKLLLGLFFQCSTVLTSAHHSF